MPTLDWLNREQALAIADAVPYRLLEHGSSHGLYSWSAGSSMAATCSRNSRIRSCQ